MSAQLEWADIESAAEVLYPGVEVDGATVEPGQVALAWWTGSNGIALCASDPAELANYLEGLANQIRGLPLPPTVEAHIPAGLRRATWAPCTAEPTPGTAIAPAGEGTTLCSNTGPVTYDPRRATCPECLDTWNEGDTGDPTTLVPIAYRLS